MRLIAENLGGERGGEMVFSRRRFRRCAPGEALIVTGPNGAGKSTLLRVIAGLLPAGSRDACASRAAGDADFRRSRAACHYLGHLNAHEDGADAWPKISPSGSASAATAPAWLSDEALDRVGLGGIGHLPFGYLSTGQRRRAAIARLLVSHRPVWLLDEPTAGLDEASERSSQADGEHCATAGSCRGDASAAGIGGARRDGL